MIPGENVSSFDVFVRDEAINHIAHWLNCSKGFVLLNTDIMSLNTNRSHLVESGTDNTDTLTKTATKEAHHDYEQSTPESRAI